VKATAGGRFPSIGRIVEYRSNTGNYTIPAVITATIDTLYRPGVEAGHVPDLSSVECVHLEVFTPGEQGRYQEHDVAFDPDAGPRTWRWPVQV
jgi:hypothetical protein